MKYFLEYERSLPFPIWHVVTCKQFPNSESLMCIADRYTPAGGGNGRYRKTDTADRHLLHACTPQLVVPYSIYSLFNCAHNTITWIKAHLLESRSLFLFTDPNNRNYPSSVFEDHIHLKSNLDGPKIHCCGHAFYYIITNWKAYKTLRTIVIAQSTPSLFGMKSFIFINRWK